MTLSPAAADTGILFRAADGTFIPATPDHVVDTRSATTVGAFGVKVRSIEHLMAAVSALGIDNLLVDVDAEEIPATDGSAQAALFTGPRSHRQVPDAGHNLPQEAPQAFAQAVLDLAAGRVRGVRPDQEPQSVEH